MIIGVSGAEGLSSPEMVTPSGIYIRDPTNVIEVRASDPSGRSELRGIMFALKIILSGSISGVG